MIAKLTPGMFPPSSCSPSHFSHNCGLSSRSTANGPTGSLQWYTAPKTHPPTHGPLHEWRRNYFLVRWWCCPSSKHWLFTPTALWSAQLYHLSGRSPSSIQPLAPASQREHFTSSCLCLNNRILGFKVTYVVKLYVIFRFINVLLHCITTNVTDNTVMCFVSYTWTILSLYVCFCLCSCSLFNCDPDVIYLPAITCPVCPVVPFVLSYTQRVYNGITINYTGA